MEKGPKVGARYVGTRCQPREIQRATSVRTGRTIVKTVEALQLETRILGQSLESIRHLSQHHKSWKKLRAYQAKVVCQMSVRIKINQCVLPATTFSFKNLVISIKHKTHRHLSRTDSQALLKNWADAGCTHSPKIKRIWGALIAEQPKRPTA